MKEGWLVELVSIRTRVLKYLPGERKGDDRVIEREKVRRD